MGLFSGRLWTILFFVALSYGLWHFLEDFTYRVLFAAVPLLFAVQVTLSDTLEDLLVSRLGWKTRWFTVLIAPGTILHELCHLIAALATGCMVTRAALFKPNPRTGVLGYVTYTYPRDRWVVFRELLIGFAPFFGCGLLLFAFNYLAGGDLLSLIDDSPITDASDVAIFLERIASSMWDAVSSLDYNEPVIWVYVYLQLCFSIGAAPSGADFKGTFKSMYRHIISALLFLAFAAFIILASDSHFDLRGYDGRVASAVAVSLKFIIVVLTLSITLILAGIPLAYLGVKTVEIRGITKTIPVTSGALAFYLINQEFSLQYALIGGLALYLLSLIVLRKSK